MFEQSKIITYEGFNKMLKDFWIAGTTHHFVGVFGSCGIMVGQQKFADGIDDDDDIMCLNRLLH